MKRNKTHYRKLNSWRRNVSLFLSVMWVTLLFQPCVMAGPAGTVAAGDHGEGHVYTGMIHSGVLEAASYAHCSDMAMDGDYWRINPGQECCDGENAIGFDNPGAFKSKIKNIQLTPEMVGQLAETHQLPIASVTAIASNGLSPGSSIIELFRVYLI